MSLLCALSLACLPGAPWMMRWGRVRGCGVIHFKLASWVGREEPVVIQQPLAVKAVVRH